MPRDEADRLLDRFTLFRATEFRLTLLEIGMDKLYGVFEKFRDWERYVHPRAEFQSQADYWEPVYRGIEDSYRKRDATGVKTGISTMVDKILHD